MLGWTARMNLWSSTKAPNLIDAVMSHGQKNAWISGNAHRQAKRWTDAGRWILWCLPASACDRETSGDPLSGIRCCLLFSSPFLGWSRRRGILILQMRIRTCNYFWIIKENKLLQETYDKRIEGNTIFPEFIIEIYVKKVCKRFYGFNSRLWNLKEINFLGCHHCSWICKKGWNKIHYR